MSEEESPETAAIEPRTTVIAGAGYAGLHVAQRLGTWVKPAQQAPIILVDHNDYHQILTELPQVASGVRPGKQVKVAVENVLPKSVSFKKSRIVGFDLAGRSLLTEDGPVPYWRLVLALGSRPNDFNIPGLAERVLFMWSANDALRIRKTLEANIQAAAQADDAAVQSRLMTVVIGGGGATGVELAGAFAEDLPEMARKVGAPAELCRVILVEAGHTILAGSPPALVAKARDILIQLRVTIMTNSAVAAVTADGFSLKSGEVVEGGAYIWAGGVKAPDLIKGSGLHVGYNGRVQVDRYLRAIDHEEIYVAGDLASVPDPDTGMALPPLAQIALSEGETVAENLRDELRGQSPEPFRHRDRGFVVSVGARRGVADVAGITLGGRLAHTLKDAIEWEYRQSLKHLRGWSAG